MPLSPEEAEALGLPPPEQARKVVLTPEQAKELGLPVVSQPSTAASVARGVGTGISLGWLDKLAGAMPMAVSPVTGMPIGKPSQRWREDPGAARREQTAANQAETDEARAAHPVAFGIGEAAGGAAAIAASPIPMASAPKLSARLAQSAKVGAGLGAVAGAGASQATDLPGTLGDAAGGAAGGAALGPVAELGITGAKQGLRWVANKAGQIANDAARRSTGATQVDITKLTRENPKRPEQVGEALLNEPIRLRSPETIGKDAKKLKTTVGKEIGDLIDAADSSGATFDAASFSQRTQRDVLTPLQANLAQRVPGHHGQIVNPAAERVGALLGEVQKKAAANNGALRVKDAHQLRKDLDVLLRGVNKSQDPSSTVVKDAINDIRGILSDEIGSTMQRAGVGDAWETANRRFGLSADIAKLSKKGQDRRLGNNAVFGFTQQVAGMGPGSAIGAISNPDDPISGALGGALVGAAGTRALQNYGAPVAARTAQMVSRMRPSTAPVSPLPAEIAALIRALEEGRPVVRPVPAAADEERR